MRRKNVLQSGYNCVLCYYTRSISYWFTIGTKWGQSSWLLFNDATRKRILWPHHFCVFYLSWQLGEIVQYLKEKPPRVSGWQAPLKNETIRHICIKQSIHGFGFAVTPEHLDCKAASWFPPIYFFLNFLVSGELVIHPAGAWNPEVFMIQFSWEFELLRDCWMTIQSRELFRWSTGEFDCSHPAFSFLNLQWPWSTRTPCLKLCTLLLCIWLGAGHVSDSNRWTCQVPESSVLSLICEESFFFCELICEERSQHRNAQVASSESISSVCICAYTWKLQRYLSLSLSKEKKTCKSQTVHQWLHLEW